jgi:hypothetical protein
MDPIDRAIDRLKESRPADAGGSESMLSASEEDLLLGRILSDVRSPGVIDNRRHARKRKGLSANDLHTCQHRLPPAPFEN